MTKKWFLAGIFAVGMLLPVLPVMAEELPETVQARSVRQLGTQLDAIEDAAIALGAPKASIYGSTSRLFAFLEDSVLSTGNTVTLHPDNMVKTLVKLSQEGADKKTISAQLVQLQRSSKL